MRLVLLSAALVLVAGVARADDKGAKPDIDGKWLIVYVEEGGKRNTTWEQQVATVKDGTLSYSKEGDERTLRLTFGGKQTVKVSATGGKDKDKLPAELSGVAIASQDYVCLSLNPADAKAPDAKADGKKSSGSFILILRRQR